MPDIRVGEPYDPQKVEETLAKWEERMRAQGFYEARASAAPNMPDDAYLIVSVARGPLVVVEFTGDPLPDKERERLVPIRAEGSTDEDLLEDAKLAIEQYLQERGFRDATADYSRDEKTPGQLKITFHVTRGPHYTIESVRITGNDAISTAELREDRHGHARRRIRWRRRCEAQRAAVADRVSDARVHRRESRGQPVRCFPPMRRARLNAASR